MMSQQSVERTGSAALPTQLVVASTVLFKIQCNNQTVQGLSVTIWQL